MTVGEEEIILKLMESSDRHSSFNDIWTVRAGDMSLFRYNATLVPWFFGLNLVRFEHTASGPVLEII